MSFWSDPLNNKTLVGAVLGGPVGMSVGGQMDAQEAQQQALDEQAALAKDAQAYSIPLIEENRAYGNALIGDNLAYGQEQMTPYQTWGNLGMGGIDQLGSYTDYMNQFNYNATPAAQYQNTQLMNSLAARGLSGQATAASQMAALAGQNYNAERDYYANNYLTDYNKYAQQMGLGLDATNSLIGMQDNATQSLLGIGNQATNALMNASGITTDALSNIAGQQGAVDAQFYAGLSQLPLQLGSLALQGASLYNTGTTPAATGTTQIPATPSLYPTNSMFTY